MVPKPELGHAPLERQPVTLPLPTPDIRMGAAGDRVDDLRVPVDHRRQRLDHRLQALAGRDQAECGEPERSVVDRRSGPRCLKVPRGALGDTHRRSMRHHADFLLRASARLDQQAKRRVRHHDHELGLRAQLREHFRLVRRGLRQHRVQRHDERLRQFLRKRQHVLPVAAAEDPVLVLKQHDVDIEPPEHPSRPDIVATHRLGDRRQHAPALRARRFVHDRDEIGDGHRARAGQRRSQVG